MVWSVDWSDRRSITSKMNKRSAVERTSAQVVDLPTGLLLSIISLVKCSRTRNSMALVCTLWRDCERQTREHLALKANLFDILHLPDCFQSVISLDLSMCSPWGHSLLSNTSTTKLTTALTNAFPKVKKLTVYIRDSLDVEAVVSIWPQLTDVSLVRWHKKHLQHQGVEQHIGSDILPVLTGCESLKSLDLSRFFCWQEDVIAALSAAPNHSGNLKSLNLMIAGLSSDAFKSTEILAIAQSCPSLQEFHCICETEPLLEDCVKDQTLEALGQFCPLLQVLEMVDKWALGASSRFVSDAQYPSLTATGVIALICNVPNLRELCLLLWKNMPNCGPLMEDLAIKCPQLTKLQIGSLLNICDVEGVPRGLARCHALREVTIKRCPTLNDKALITLSDSCRNLRRVDLWNCQEITATGLASMADALKKTLRSVTICQCNLVTTAETVKALTPLRPTLESLQLDCDWRNLDTGSTGILANSCVQTHSESVSRPWSCLKDLILWAQPGTLLTPLPFIGLMECPALEEVRINVEGDCREIPLPCAPVFGISVLARFPQLTKISVDLSEVIGFTMTCKPGFVDLPIWERFYLHGIQTLHCETLQYWPPSDADLNRRSLSLPVAAILSECYTVRRISIHGTANEHLLRMLIRCKRLRDLHVWCDYYPAPEDEMSSEMRMASRKRLRQPWQIRDFLTNV